ncbi:MAG: TspO/MBR family protein [Armatimonadota bacterium]|nr:TspO/MBR family protein [Armatimonadota bacterium]MDR7548403.1 TspO/MBR family protein [Armatimonadota bacterium]
MNLHAQRWVALGLFVLLCYGTAALGSMATARSVGDWYAGIRKPAWTPPTWLFGPVWTLVYASMAVAGWLAWKQTGWFGAPAAFMLFALQLVLNAVWSWLFFALRNPGAALVGMGLLWLSILVVLILFWRIAPAAGWLLVPYLGWVTFAAVLNLRIWRLNA